MSNESPTAKKQSIVHIGSTLRDALEAIGATYEPPMRWQDLARQVIKNFTGAVQHDAVLKAVTASSETQPRQMSFSIKLDGEKINEILEKHLAKLGGGDAK